MMVVGRGSEVRGIVGEDGEGGGLEWWMGSAMSRRWVLHGGRVVLQEKEFLRSASWLDSMIGCGMPWLHRGECFSGEESTKVEDG